MPAIRARPDTFVVMGLRDGAICFPLPHKGEWGKAAALIGLSTVADTEISNPPWVNFQSAGWVNFPSAPTTCFFRQAADRENGAGIHLRPIHCCQAAAHAGKPPNSAANNGWLFHSVQPLKAPK